MCWSKETELNEDNYYIKNYLTGSWLGVEGIPKANKIGLTFFKKPTK